jgi:hypothetical protein
VSGERTTPILLLGGRTLELCGNAQHSPVQAFSTFSELCYLLRELRNVMSERGDGSSGLDDVVQPVASPH